MSCLATSTRRGVHSARQNSAHLTQTTSLVFVIRIAGRVSVREELCAIRIAPVVSKIRAIFAKRKDRPGIVARGAQVACKIGGSPA